MFEKQIKKLSMWCLALVKIAVVAFAFALVKYEPIMNWVQSTNIWWFLGVMIIAIVIVQYKVWS